MVEIKPALQKELDMTDAEYKAYINGFKDCNDKVLKRLEKSISV